MPNISIVVPAYNAGNFIVKCIDSCLDQNYKDFEIVVVDDGSTDNTSIIVKALCEEYPETVRYFFKNNGGVSSARNLGIINARGNYIAFLDSDDVYLPNKLNKSIDFMVKNNFDWMCTAFDKIFDNNIREERRIISSDFLDKKTNEIFLLKNGVFFFSNLAITPSTVIVKKICFNDVGLFDSKFKAGEDWDMWFRLEMGGYRCGYLDESLTKVIHNKQSITKKGDIDCLYCHLILAEKYSRLIGFDKNLKGLFRTLMEIARNYYYNKKYSKMVSVLLKWCYYKIRFIFTAVS